MTGSVVDLSLPGAKLPNRIVVDTNLIVERLVAPLIRIRPQPVATIHAERAKQFFNDLAAHGTGIVTPTVFGEFIHTAIKFKYKQVWSEFRTTKQETNGRPIRDWIELYKQDATILRAFRTDLELLRQLLTATGLIIVSPDELGPIASGRTYDEELIHLVGTYGLDSNDALILMEASRYGISDIISLDHDMRRAEEDFNIFTWLS